MANKLQPGDLVIVKVKEVQQNSVLVEIIDHNLEGIIHISEVASSFVRDIRKFVKQNEVTVCQVLPNRGKHNFIDLSLKRVNERQKRERIEEWQQEKKAEKFINKLINTLKEDKDLINKNVIRPLQSNYGTTFKGFETAIKDPESLKTVLKERYFKAVLDIAKENIRIKEYTLNKTIKLSFIHPNGIEHIKKALSIENPEKEKMNIEYLSAPKYKIKITGGNIKNCRDLMNRTIEKIREYAEENKGEFSVEKE